MSTYGLLLGQSGANLSLSHDTEALADLDWLVRYVLQYGSEGEMLESASAHVAVRERLQAVVAALHAPGL